MRFEVDHPAYIRMRLARARYMAAHAVSNAPGAGDEAHARAKTVRADYDDAVRAYVRVRVTQPSLPCEPRGDTAAYRVLAASYLELHAVVETLVACIDATGGLIRDEKGVVVPNADPEWLDLGTVCLEAYEALGRKPVIRNPDDEEDADHG